MNFTHFFESSDKHPHSNTLGEVTLTTIQSGIQFTRLKTDVFCLLSYYTVLLLWSCLILKRVDLDFKAPHHCCARTSITIASNVQTKLRCEHHILFALSCTDCDFHMWMKLEGHYCDLPETKPGQEGDTSTEGETNKLEYCVTDVPPWYLCILLGIQVWQTPLTPSHNTHTEDVVSQPLLVVLLRNVCMFCCMFCSFGVICCVGFGDLLQLQTSLSLWRAPT